jgi:hypothetical protein
MLANFFIYIDERLYPGKFQTLLVYGYSMPEGKNVFVMRKFTNPVTEFTQTHNGKTRGIHAFNIEIWSPCTGECFNFNAREPANSWLCVKSVPRSFGMYNKPREPVCPLRHIFTLVSHDNIYANI